MRPVWRIASTTVVNFLDEEGLQWSGAVAFYLVLSVPPLLIAAASIGVAVFGPETTQGFLVDQIAHLLPVERGIVGEIVQQTVQGSGAAALVAVGFLLFTGSRVFASLIVAINLMWQEVESAGFWRRQVQRFGMVLSVGVLLLFSGVVDLTFAFANELLDLPTSVRIITQSQIVPGLFIASGLFLLFYLIPSRAATWQTALTGAVLGAIGLRIAQSAFTTYLRAFGGFGSAYGPIAGLAAVLTWALAASSIILLAAHLVAVLNSADREPRPEHRAPGRSQALRRPKPSKREQQ